VSRVLSLALEPISKSGVHYLARAVSSKVRVASKLSVKGVWVYVWSAVDVDSGELLGDCQLR